MKFICSILILAGVFALNAAFPFDDDKMRLANDKLILEDLKQIRANDNKDATTSAACSQEYLDNLSKILENFNTALKGCEDAAENAIVALNNTAKAKIDEFNSSITDSCKSDCLNLTEPLDVLDCIEEETSKNSRVLSDISVAAATVGIELTKAIANTQGIRDVCDQKCYSDYSVESQNVEDSFKKCVNKKDE